MQFKNLKASEVEGRVDVPGLADWLDNLSGGEASVLITAPAGTGKTAAVGAIARKLHHDVMQCDLLQVFRYPDSKEALRSILAIADNLRAVVFQADGIDRLAERFRESGDPSALEELRHWLAEKRDSLRAKGVSFVATGRKMSALPDDLRAEFEKTFAASN